MPPAHLAHNVALLFYEDGPVRRGPSVVGLLFLGPSVCTTANKQHHEVHEFVNE